MLEFAVAVGYSHRAKYMPYCADVEAKIELSKR